MSGASAETESSPRAWFLFLLTGGSPGQKIARALLLIVLVIGIVAKHRLPATRQIDAFGLSVEVPDAVVRRQRDEFLPLAKIRHQFPVAQSLQAGRQ